MTLAIGPIWRYDAEDDIIEQQPSHRLEVLMRNEWQSRPPRARAVEHASC